MSRCLVTGGAGFVGSHLVDSLVFLGHEVFIIDDESSVSRKTFHWNSKAKKIYADLRDYSKVIALFKNENPEYVFHLAANSHIQQAVRNPRLVLENNILGTINIFDCSRLYKVKRVLFASSASVCESEGSSNAYSLSKIFGEKLVKLYYEQYGLESVGLRCFNIYGERQVTDGEYIPIIGALLNAKKTGKDLEIYGDGTQERDFVYVGDVVKSNILAMFSHDCRVLGEIIEVGTGKSHSIIEIARRAGVNIKFSAPKEGEIKVSRADTNKIIELLNFLPENSIEKWLNDQQPGKE